MPGSTAEPAGIAYSTATRTDAAEIADLLRRADLGGWVRLSLARDPDPFAADFGLGTPHAFILARDTRTSRLAGVCEVSVRDVWLKGNPARLAYLGALRIDPDYRHRVAILVGGFERVGELLREAELPRLGFTAITDDNASARRLLTAGLPRLPAYLPAVRLVTLALATASRHRLRAPISTADKGEWPKIAAFLRDALRARPLAPVWHSHMWDDAERHGGAAPAFAVTRAAGSITGCIAMWDQRAAKQTVVRGYSGVIGAARPLANLALPLLRLPTLPPAGTALDQIFLSHFAVATDEPAARLALIEAGLALAHQRGARIALLGLAADDALLPAIRKRFGGLAYRSTIYIVHWPETAAAARDLVDDIARGPLHTEVAVL